MLHRSFLLLRLRVVVAERRLMVQRVVVADKLPANFVVIAAVHRAGKEADDCVSADRGEEWSLLDGGEDADLLRGCQRREFARVRIKLLRLGLKILESLQVDGL